MIDLRERRPVPAGVLAAMAEAMTHRGPDEDGFYSRPGLGMVSRRLNIVGLEDGRQPICNQDRSVVVVFNGEVFEYPEWRAKLEGRGHRFTTHCDTEVIVHLWDEYQEGMFEHLRGQFALALWDQRRRQLILARDRIGICPLHWTRQDGWLLFASEIKALLASGLVSPRPDPRGINHLFTFFALPGPLTCFQGVEVLLPGHYHNVQLGEAGAEARSSDRTYWEMDFPDRGEEAWGSDPRQLVDELEDRLLRSVEHRLRADVPVVAYLSGGVDSSLVAAMARRLRGKPLSTFTLQIQEPGLDESGPAFYAARQIGTEPTLVACASRDIVNAYPDLIQAAEAPLPDTCCAALLLLARTVHSHGFKVALTGEGADEMLAGYPWYKLHKVLGWLNAVPGMPVGEWARRAFFHRLGPPRLSLNDARRVEKAVGGHHAWLDFYALVGLAKARLYGPRLREVLDPALPFADLHLNLDRLRRWHPLNQSLYFGIRVHLPGLLLSLAGDRAAMHSAVETRYPFLSEDVITFLAGLHPRWKLRGFRDKYLMRLVAERWLPKAVAWRPKKMFRASFDLLNPESSPAFLDQLLSPESLRRTGYFDPEGVRHWRRAVRCLQPGSGQRVAVEIGLAGVVATQLWHHTFIDDNLADLPSYKANLPSDRRMTDDLDKPEHALAEKFPEVQ